MFKWVINLVLLKWAAILLTLVILSAGVSFPYLTIDTVETKVFKTERVNDTYRVHTNDETFENVDSFAFLKFNSGDVDRVLSQGGEFRLTVNGFRFGFLSMFRNIIKVEKL